jgi:hypothetical protein
MRIPCDSDFYLSIERALPSDDDVCVVVEVRCPGFTGRIDTWILRDAWIAFCNQLEALEGRRRGEAVVESISPNEFRLTVRSTDSAGHMAIEGLLGYRGVKGETLLTFSPMSFDPSTLPALLAEARAIAG